MTEICDDCNAIMVVVDVELKSHMHEDLLRLHVTFRCPKCSHQVVKKRGRVDY